jgi:dipeptidyl aminopeptidase/acylaminoacyl peptidase
MPQQECSSRSAHWLAALVLITSLACKHGSPAEPEPPSALPPVSSGSPVRLTFNKADDRTPSWLPDGSGIIYSSERVDRNDRDRCLNVLPAAGGTISASYCQLSPIHDDSTDLMESPAQHADGRLFYHRIVSWVGQQKLGASALVLGSRESPLQATVVQPLPYTAPDGRFHSSIRSPQWIGRDSVLYLAEQLFYEGSTFYPDTFYTGLDATILDLSGASARVEVIPGTDYASGVALGDDGQTLYYTLGGDSRVYRRSLSTGEVTTLYDFGAGTIVRDPQVRGTRLVAVVGGSVLYHFEDAHGYVQRDEGGDLTFVNLSDGSRRLFTGDSVLFRHPVISPDGSHIVVEVQPFAPVHSEPESEFNAPNHRADLWLFALE